MTDAADATTRALTVLCFAPGGADIRPGVAQMCCIHRLCLCCTSCHQVQAQEADRRQKEVAAVTEALGSRMAAQNRLLLQAKEADVTAAVTAATQVCAPLSHTFSRQATWEARQEGRQGSTFLSDCALSKHLMEPHLSPVGLTCMCIRGT